MHQSYPVSPQHNFCFLSFLIDCIFILQDLYSFCYMLDLISLQNKNFIPTPISGQTKKNNIWKERLCLEAWPTLPEQADEHFTYSFKVAAVLSVTLCDTSGWKQMERAHWGALVVICSYSRRWRGPGKTNTSVVPLCYIKLLLSLTEQRTRWSGAMGVSRLQVGSSEQQNWVLGSSKSLY